MTPVQIFEQMVEKAKELTIADAKSQCLNLANDFTDDAMVICDAIIKSLMDRMPESEFVDFCAKVEAALVA